MLVRTFNDLNISNSHYGKSITGNEKLAKNFQSSFESVYGINRRISLEHIILLLLRFILVIKH